MVASEWACMGRRSQMHHFAVPATFPLLRTYSGSERIGARNRSAAQGKLSGRA